ncbi:sensor histidine kinase [Lysinibacillus sp. 54212]|uniref:sensor histidine kinase n=1 Tax=Lysinibacillus sp. 54212 TaxID=3119829 RepID=UPI002FC9E9CB
MKKRKLKLIIVLSTVLLVLFTTVNVYTSYVKMKETVEETIANQNLEAAKSISAAIDIDTYKKYLKNPTVKNEYYWEIRSYLNDAREKLGALYLYTIEIDNPKVSTLLIIGLPNEVEDGYIIGEVCTVPEEQVKRAYDGKTFVTGVIKDPVNGTYVTVGVPIKDELNKVIGYLAIDISIHTLNDIKAEVLENNFFMFVFNGVFIFIVIGSFLLLQRWYQKEVAKEVGDTEDTYQAQINTLITSVSSLRHDFTNHIQVIHGFLQLDEIDLAQQYLLSLSKEVEAIEAIKINVDHPSLSILLQTKKLAAKNHQINMDFTISDNSFDKIKTTDLIKILSNLIDNAIEAANDLPENERKITISCIAEDTHYRFEITNTGQKILQTEYVFKQGYSTKESVNGKIRGQGLFIVKEVVNKYHGTISIKSRENVTTAIVRIPL